MAGFNVVYRYLDGPSKGLSYWTTYLSTEEFEAARTPEQSSKLEVLAAGVSMNDAIDVCERNTLPDDLVAHARAKATNPTTGKINPKILEIEMMTVHIATHYSK